MTKKILTISDIVLKRALDIVAIIFLVMNFYIWYLNDANMDLIKYDLYHKMIFYLFISLLLNAYRLNPKTFIKDNIFFILIFALGLYNSLDIIMDFNGIVVDMGLRSKDLILQAFPTFLVILAVFKLTDRRALIIALIIILFMIIGYSLLAILNEHKGLDIFKGFPIIKFEERHQSILNNPNVLGEYTFIGLFIALFLSLISKPFWLKLVSLLPIPILAYGLILSGSRTGLVMLIILYIMINVYFMYFKKNSRIVLLLGNLVLIICIFLVLNGYFSEFIEKIRGDVNLSGRVPIWMNTLSMIDDYIYKGIGYNNFTYVYNEIYGKITSPHNMLIGTLSELGFFALVLIFGWFSYLFIRNHNTIIRNKDSKYITYLILFNVFYITFFLGQMTEYSLLKFSSINTLFLAMIGINQTILIKVNSDKENNLINWILYIVSFGVYYLININSFLNKGLVYLNVIIFVIILTVVSYCLKYIKIKDNYFLE